MALEVYYQDAIKKPKEIAAITLLMFIKYHSGYKDMHKAEVQKEDFALKLDWLEMSGTSIPKGFRTAATKHYKKMFFAWKNSGVVPGINGVLMHHPV